MTAAQYKVDHSKKEATYETKVEIGCLDLLRELREVVGREDSMQNPNFFGTPHARFSRPQAQKAKELASEIIAKCLVFINQD